MNKMFGYCAINSVAIGVVGMCISILLSLASSASAVVNSEKNLKVLPAAINGSAIAPLMSLENREQSYLVVDEQQGIRWLDTEGKQLAHLHQSAELLDWRTLVVPSDATTKKSIVIVATVFLPEQQPGLVMLDTATQQLRELARLPVPAFKIENLCLSRDSANNLSLYLLDERGTAEHWLVADAKGNALAKHLRNLPIPPNSKSCAVDDEQDLLFIVEESVGVWAFGASAETAPGRRVVDMAAPFGKLADGVESLAVVPQGLLILAPEQKMLMLYRTAQSKFTLQQTIELTGVDAAEGLTAQYTAATKKISAVVNDEATGGHALQLPWQLAAPAKSTHPLISISADVQTETMARFGDAADDPAIWVHKKHPHKSLVIGTNKQQGLFVYDLKGRQVQHFNTGKLNNVDVRYGVPFGKKIVDIAVATNRDDNSLAIYTIDPKNGKLIFSGRIATGLEEIYGLCLYQNSNGITYAIPNAKSGEFQQIQLTAVADQTNKNALVWQGKKVRSFFVNSQPEGCVADDKNQRLFVGEEDEAVWTIGAEPNAGEKVEPVMHAGEILVADVEGMGIYQGKQKNYLVVSSQGNNSFIILETSPPYKLRGIVQIDMAAEKGIDGVSETDGLDVSHANFGGPFSEGMLVVQDGHKVMPEAPQNFKYVGWEKIRRALNLE